MRKAESDQIVEALRARGVDVPCIIKENVRRGSMPEENSLEVHRGMEGFFAKHLRGRVG